jgi:transposase
MDLVIVGIDLGKNSCSLACLDALGRVVLRRRMRRSSLESFVMSLQRCVVAMEACCGAHHLGRVFAAQGFWSPCVMIASMPHGSLTTRLPELQNLRREGSCSHA